MFEINLVPDIKNDLLTKQRISNFVLFVCIIVAIVAGGIVILLGAIVGGQNIAMANQDTEITCRSTGELENGNCNSSYGTPVLKVENLNEFLTIQDQMNKLSTVNGNKLLLSRVFGVLDVLLPTGEDTVSVSELNVDLEDATLTFEAQGNSASNIDYRALEVFKKSAELAYYDYGRYMRRSIEGDFIEIPTMCITERMENGILYGIYKRGTKGCETPLIGELADEEAAVERQDIKIRRTYNTTAERDAYMTENNDNDGGYYFDSACAAYDDNDRFSESATAEACPLLSGDLTIRDSSNGRDANDRLVLRFNTTIAIDANIFSFLNKHMRVVGPSRQNVTDSYTQIRDMFAEQAAECDPTDTQCINSANGVEEEQ